jgi:antitoxin (DNA-binding transcriptional repressor) of toxin-antitoxin stability system
MHISLNSGEVTPEKLISRALRDEEIIICRWGKPVVRLEPIPAAKRDKKKLRRVPGRLAGKISDSKGLFEPPE